MEADRNVVLRKPPEFNSKNHNLDHITRSQCHVRRSICTGDMNMDSDISVLGTGNMGTACVRALLRRHKRVTVWNRTPSKVTSLAKDGAQIAATAWEAIGASPLSVMAVLDHSAALPILDDADVRKSLLDRTILQTTTGRPNELELQRDLVNRCGGRFLGGSIFTFPRGIGRPHVIGICAGDAAAFEEHREMLRGIANFQYLGLDLAAAVGASMTLGAMMMGTMALFYETTAVARHFGLSLDAYFALNKLAWEETWTSLCDGALRIATGEFDGSQAPVDMIVSGMPDFLATLKESGVSIGMIDAMVRQLELTRAVGGGKQEMAFMTEALWTTRRVSLIN
jgi:3-hydroxyisobutyrate dehydrogenase-like beta-hydroxyacid dehydrogenase